MIEKLFKQGKSVNEISKLLKLTRKEVKDYLINLGYKRYLTNPEKAILIKKAALEYDSSVSLTKLGKKYNLNLNLLSEEIKDLGISIINHQNEAKFDETIFDIIDTEEKAYWLGFIFADGTISSHSKNKKNRYQFELSLSLKDQNHLNKFNKFMKHSGNNVKIDSYRCRWIINSKHLWNSLNNLGCVPNKSKCLQFPKINSEFYYPFIRGYMDGDGCIGIYGKRPYCQCIGTKSFLNSIKSICKIEINLGHDLRWSDEIFNFQLSGEKCVNYLDKIYGNSSIYLDRKYQKYLEVCRLWEQSHKLSEGKNGEDCDANTVIT